MNRFWRGRRIPLSWLLLTRQPVRLLVALAGISFAGILMFMQLGFRDGLFDASVTAHRLFDADVVLISPRSARLRYHCALPPPRRRPCTIPVPVNQWYFSGSGGVIGLGPLRT